MLLFDANKYYRYSDIKLADDNGRLKEENQRFYEQYNQ